jgi:hypothetical protein
MKAMDTDKLLYLSYSEQSTTAFIVKFDEYLWSLISTEVNELFNKEKISKPSRMRSNVRKIKEQLKVFVSEQVEFLCEMPSIRMTDVFSGVLQCIFKPKYTLYLQSFEQSLRCLLSRVTADFG